MGAISRYLTMLDDTQRDRVLMAQEWVGGRYGHDDGPRCLVGHAECAHFAEDAPRATALYAREGLAVEETFDRAYRRFGKDPVVRAVKLRCAYPDRAARLSSQQQTPELERVGR